MKELFDAKFRLPEASSLDTSSLEEANSEESSVNTSPATDKTQQNNIPERSSRGTTTVPRAAAEEMRSHDEPLRHILRQSARLAGRSDPFRVSQSSS